MVVDLVDEVVVDAGAIPGAWDQVRIVGSVVGLPPAITPEDEKLLRGRATTAGRAVGMPDEAGTTMPARAGDCGVVLLVAAEPAIN